MNSGIIDYNGNFIPCAEGQHVCVMGKNRHVAPFVVFHYGVFEFEDEYLCPVGVKESRKQVDTVFDLCTKLSLNFDKVFFGNLTKRAVDSAKAHEKLGE